MGLPFSRRMVRTNITRALPNTQMLYIKATKSERLSDTVQFQHKSITNPTVSPKDKLMNAIAACQQALNNATNDKSNNEINMLQAILNKAREQVTGEAVEPEDKQTLPRVQKKHRKFATAQ